MGNKSFTWTTKNGEDFHGISSSCQLSTDLFFRSCVVFSSCCCVLLSHSWDNWRDESMNSSRWATESSKSFRSIWGMPKRHDDKSVNVVIILFSYFDGLVPDCSISSANALEILQSCTKPSIWFVGYCGLLLPHSTDLVIIGSTNTSLPDWWQAINWRKCSFIIHLNPANTLQ